eukprot:1150086-Pelagomonas_calceolata.AAC.1
MGDQGRGLWNGLLAGEPGAHLDGWLTTRRTCMSLVASGYAFSWWDSLSVSALTVGSFLNARWHTTISNLGSCRQSGTHMLGASNNPPDPQ